MLAERHARIDDLALLVDLVSSGWKGVSDRLERVERATAGPHVRRAARRRLARLAYQSGWRSEAELFVSRVWRRPGRVHDVDLGVAVAHAP